MSKYPMVRLEDVCDKATSSIAQKDLKNLEGIYPIYGAGGFIKNVNFYKQDREYIAIVKDGAGIGRAMILPAFSSVIGTMQYILPKDNIITKYLYFAIDSMNLAKYFTGATIPHIYFKDYKNESLPLPPIEHQRSIIKILESIVSLIIKRKQQLSKFDELAKSRFLEMFGDPISNSKGWEITKLEDLGELSRGISKSRPRNLPELLGGKYPLVQTGDVANSELYITRYNSTYSELGLKQSKMWKAGTLCITIAANIAKTAILKFDACFPDSIVGFKSNGKTNQIFIHYIFSFFQELLESQAPTVAQKNINLQTLQNLMVICPPSKFQNDFESFIQQLDKSKFRIKKSLEKLEMTYKALLQEYFG